MTRFLGVLCIVLALYGVILTSDAGRTAGNHKDLARELSLFGVLTLGVGILIITGGIDLSIGSVCCLASIFFALSLKSRPGRVTMQFLYLSAVCVAVGITYSARNWLTWACDRMTSRIPGALKLRAWVSSLIKAILTVASVMSVAAGLGWLLVEADHSNHLLRYVLAALPVLAGVGLSHAYLGVSQHRGRRWWLKVSALALAAIVALGLLLEWLPDAARFVAVAPFATAVALRLLPLFDTKRLATADSLSRESTRGLPSSNF